MPRASHAIVVCVLSLLVLGLIMVTSAGMTVESERGVTFAGVLTGRTALYALLALVMLAAGAVTPVEWIVRHPRAIAQPVLALLVASVVTLCLVHIEGVGREVNGARRWIAVGPLTFQPSELAKWSMIFVLAWYGSVKQWRLPRFWLDFVPGMLLILAVTGLIVIEDLGTAVLVGATSITLLYVGGARMTHLLAMLPLPTAMVVLAILTSPYRIGRITTFLDPYADPQGGGYHMIQSMAAIAGGEVTGRGLGHGIHKFEYLPEDTTDFIFAVICEELGVFGAGLVAALYAALLLAMLSVLRRQEGRVEQTVCLGVMLTVGMQALMNLAVVTGMAPTKGIALPLLSSGGTGWILTSFSLGVIVGIDRRTRIARSAAMLEVKGGAATAVRPESIASAEPTPV